MHALLHRKQMHAMLHRKQTHPVLSTYSFAGLIGASAREFVGGCTTFVPSDLSISVYVCMFGCMWVYVVSGCYDKYVCIYVRMCVCFSQRRTCSCISTCVCMLQCLWFHIFTHALLTASLLICEQSCTAISLLKRSDSCVCVRPRCVDTNTHVYIHEYIHHSRLLCSFVSNLALLLAFSSAVTASSKRFSSSLIFFW